MRILAGMLLFLFTCAYAQAYRDQPAMIYLNRGEQPDTCGFNLVADLAGLIYPTILNGSTDVYSGPDQSLRIDADAFKQIEQQSSVFFTESPDLFVYELWTVTKRHTEFSIAGFSFLGKTKNGEKVSFGFIPLTEVENLLREHFIPVNMNGSYQITFNQALYSRKYHYNLVQLGNRTFHEKPEESFKEKNAAFGSGRIIRNKVELPERKLIVYQVSSKKYPTDIDRSNELILAVQKMLEENKEVYFNLGGLRMTDPTKKNYGIPRVKALMIEEIWVNETREPRSTKIRMQVIFDEGALDITDIAEFDRAGCFIRLSNLKDFLHAKEFETLILRINDQPLQAEYTNHYLEALRKSDWSKISSYAGAR